MYSAAWRSLADKRKGHKFRGIGADDDHDEI